MEEFEEIFEDLEDPRTGNAKRHELHEILVIGFCTLLSGGETCADMALFGRSKLEFLQEFLRLEHGVPSHDTFSRVFRLLDPDRFHAWFIGFMRGFAETCQGVVAIDGKTALDILDCLEELNFWIAEAKVANALRVDE